MRVLLDDRPRVAEDVRVALELARAVGEHANERGALSRALEVRLHQREGVVRILRGDRRLELRQHLGKAPAVGPLPARGGVGRGDRGLSG